MAQKTWKSADLLWTFRMHEALNCMCTVAVRWHAFKMVFDSNSQKIKWYSFDCFLFVDLVENFDEACKSEVVQ